MSSDPPAGVGPHAEHPLSRRRLLAGGAGLAASGVLGGALARTAAASIAPVARAAGARAAAAPSAEQLDALAVLGRRSLSQPGTLPDPSRPPGADLLPGIEHIVVVMLENHSYDNLLGMLGRRPGQTPRGDGFTLDGAGRPTATNPRPDGRIQRAFRMPTTCQLPSQPSQEWSASHNAYNGGAMDGFVTTPIYIGSSTLSGPVAMGYWDARDLPFTYALATAFPLADRWFSSALAQTDPNRRFLIAGTALGETDNIGGGPGNIIPDATFGAPPANGTIFTRMSNAGVPWTAYVASFPTGDSAELYPVPDALVAQQNNKPVEQFFADAAGGTLPAVSFVEPNYDVQSQENPQNIVEGEAFLERVVRALGASPRWRQTMLIYTYDEHGGYYDHVPPPVALAPDNVPPSVQPGESTYEGYARYGIRVPGIVVSPYARPGFLSGTVYDHTSILATIERKWNLASMTLRDANANDLFGMLDLGALARGVPTFPVLPALPPSGRSPATLACSRTGPGTIPPPDSIGPAPEVSGTVSQPGSGRPVRLVVRFFGRHRHPRGVAVEVFAEHGALSGLTLELRHGRHVVAAEHLAHVGHRRRRSTLRAHGGDIPPAGHYTLLVRRGPRTLLRRRVTIR